jgi:hypothetical protein
MIIRRHHFTKDSVVNIGNKYIQSFLKRLYPTGLPAKYSNVKLTVSPDDIMVTQEEANLKVISKIVEWDKKNPPLNENDKKSREVFVTELRADIKNGNGFVIYDLDIVPCSLAYVPARQLNTQELKFVKKVGSAFQGKLPATDEAWNSVYFNVRLESELVHLIIRRIFSSSLNNGIDETFDLLSGLYVQPMNVRIITNGNKLEKNEELEQALQKKHLDDRVLAPINQALFKSDG